MALILNIIKHDGVDPEYYETLWRWSWILLNMMVLILNIIKHDGVDPEYY